MSTPPKITFSHIFGAGPSTPPRRTSSVTSSPTLGPLRFSPINAPPSPPPQPTALLSLIRQSQETTHEKAIAFQNALTTAYSASKPDGSGYIWCPVFKRYLPTPLIKHFHIINPNDYYSEAIGYLFGNTKPGEYHFDSLANGMIMAKCIADLVISGDFSIIPVEESSKNDLTGPAFRSGAKTVRVGSKAWKELSLEGQTSLLDNRDTKESIKAEGDSPNPGIKLKLALMKPYNSHCRVEDMDLLYADIHNTVLEFKSSFRPDLRYCYFRYISSILIWLNLKEAKAFENAWRPKEKWLRESLVAEMVSPERLANWDVYEEIVAGNGLFYDGDEDGDTIVKMDNGWMTTKSGEMAAQLEWGLLTSPDYMFPPQGHGYRDNQVRRS